MWNQAKVPPILLIHVTFYIFSDNKENNTVCDNAVVKRGTPWGIQASEYIDIPEIYVSLTCHPFSRAEVSF